MSADSLSDEARAQVWLIGAVHDTLAAEGMRGWLFGGWGLDARVGRISREHGDVEFWVERVHATRSRDVLIAAGANTLATQPPEESYEFTWNGVQFSTAYFDQGPDGWYTVQGRWADWTFPPDSFEDDLQELQGTPVRVMSVAGMLAMKEQYPHLRKGRPLRPKDVEDLTILRRLSTR